MADDDVEKVVKLKRPANMGREVPFIVGKNVGKSHSVTANLQKMYSMLKSHNPALCTLCSNYKQRFGTAVRSSESPHHPMTFESILDAHARSREDNTETSAKPQFQTRSRSRSLGRSRSRVRYSVAEVGDAKNDKNMLSVPDVEDSQPKSGDLPDDGIPDDILQMPNSGIERVIKGLEDEFRHLKMHYQLLVKEYEQLDPIKNINGNEEAVENGKLPVHKETLQAVADDLRMVIHNMTVKSDQITTLREIQLLNASSSNDTLQPSASRPQSRPISSRSYSSKGPTYLRSNCSVPNGTMDYQSTVSSTSSNPPSSIAGKSSVAAQAGSVMDHEDSDLRPISRTGRTKSATVNSRKKSRSQSKRRFEDERGIKMTDMDDYDEDAPVTYAAQSRFMNSLSLLKGSQKVQRVLAEQ
ncbi:hypothetical protein BKA69DRAFT_1093005 [Paraphysoderma sedebokerense]|nr:hypothetical protein BKA69DRAFT_1093005 [Paraphysoderma sedebokerense]